MPPLKFDPTMREMLEQMSEGVIVLDRQGQVRAYNRRGQPWVHVCQPRLGEFKRLIDQEEQGRAVLPARLLMVPGGSGATPSTKAWLSKIANGVFVIFLVPPREGTGSVPGSTPPPISEKLFIALLGTEIREQMSELRRLFHEATGNGARDDAAIAARTTRIDTLLQEISDLSTLQQRDEVFADERLMLTDIISTIVPTLPSQHDGSSTTFKLDLEPDLQGPVYGNARWLERALRTLLEGLSNGAPPHSEIEVAVKQVGNFMAVTGRVVIGSASSTRRVQVAGPAPVVREPERPDAPVRLMMCRRIVELHGGQLKLTFMGDGTSNDEASGHVESFSLMLVTGMPLNERSRRSCIDCRYPLQAQAYAADMAILLSKK